MSKEAEQLRRRELAHLAMQAPMYLVEATLALSGAFSNTLAGGGCATGVISVSGKDFVFRVSEPGDSVDDLTLALRDAIRENTTDDFEPVGEVQ